MAEREDLKTLAGHGGHLGEVTSLQGTDVLGVWRGGAGAMQLGYAAVDAVRSAMAGVVDLRRYVSVANGLTDNTAAIQAAINAAPAGGTVLGHPGHHYLWTNLSINKSLTLDFNGAQATVDPTTSGVSGAPAIWGQGSVGTERVLATDADEGALTITVTAGETAFEPGDYVVVRDDEVVPAWSPEAQPFTGKIETSTVASRDGTTITLGSPLINSYRTADNARVAKLNSTPTIHVKNIRRLEEVDPGGAYSGAFSGNVPHIIHFQHCLQPLVENVHMDGFQLHGVNAHRSISPVVRACSFANGFRPAEDGHAYGVRFDAGIGGLAVANHGLRLRHLVDVIRGLGPVTAYNIDLQTFSASYLSHGHGTVGWLSCGDVAIGQVGTGRSAFGLGNPSFAGRDRRLTLISPYAEGITVGIAAHAFVEDCTVSDPTLRPTDRGIVVTSGSKRVKITGGVIDLRGVLETSPRGILIREKVRLTDAAGAPPVDLEVRGTTIYTAASGTAVSVEDLAGTYKQDGVTIVAQAGVTAAVDIGIATMPAEVIINGGTFKGAATRHLNIRADADLIHVIGNTFRGYTTEAASIAPIVRMNVTGNIMEAAGDIAFTAAVPAGAVVANNAPEAV